MSVIASKAKYPRNQAVGFHLLHLLKMIMVLPFKNELKRYAKSTFLRNSLNFYMLILYPSPGTFLISSSPTLSRTRLIKVRIAVSVTLSLVQMWRFMSSCSTSAPDCLMSKDTKASSFFVRAICTPSRSKLFLRGQIHSVR